MFGKDKWSGNTDKNFEQHGFQDFFSIEMSVVKKIIKYLV